MKDISNTRTQKLGLAILLSLFFSFAWAQSPDELVECDLGAYYQTVKLKSNRPGEGSRNDFILYRINPISGQFTFIANLSVSDGPDDIAVPRSVNVNSLGVNPIDRQFYFINAKSPYQLYKMTATGKVSYLGNITGDISGNNQAGVFNYDGRYYVSGGSKKIFEIDINNLTSTRLMNVNFVASDLAINPNNGRLYGWDQNRRQLNIADTANQTTTTVGPAANTSDFSIFGALYFLPTGQLIGYGDNTTIGPQGNSQESLVDINLDTGGVTPITTSLSVSTNDGASCPFTIALDKAGPSEISLNSTITYTFTVYNRTGRLINDVVFQDILPSGLVFSSEPYDITNNIVITGSTDQQNAANLNIDNIALGSASFKIDVFIGCDYSETTLSNQALIGLTNLDDAVSSNDPNTAQINDPTNTDINQPTIDVPAEITIEGCDTSDITSDVAVFDFSEIASRDIKNVFDSNPDYNYAPDDIVSITYVDFESSTDACGTEVLRTFTLTDNCGNQVSARQTIKVVDTIAPVIDDGFVPIITVECDQDITLSYTATDNCDGEVLGQFEDTIVPGTCPNDYVISRSWSFTDSCGNASRYEQTIVVKDETAPEFVLSDTDCGVNLTNKDFEDNTFNNSSLLILQEQVPGWSNASNKFIRVVRTNADIQAQSGTYCIGLNTTIASDIYQVIETEPGSNITIDFFHRKGPNTTAQENKLEVFIGKDLNNLTSLGEFTPSELDSWTKNSVNYAVPADQTSSVLMFKSLSSRNSSSGNYLDNISISSDSDSTCLPQDIVVECNEVPEAPLLQATDNCSDVVIDYEETTIEGDCPNNYTIVRTWTATDACGNTASHTQNVTVQDTKAPVVDGEIPNIITLECDETVELYYTAIDNCDGEIQGEFEDTIVPGECENDYVISRTWSFTDSCGNASRYEQTIVIKDEEAPEFIGDLPQDITVECDNIPDPSVIEAIDNCGDATVTLVESKVDGDCPNNYTLVRRWTATDACGNTNTHSQTIAVQDTTSPVMEDIPAIVTVSCDEELNLSYSAVDNCDGEIQGDYTEVVTPGECANEAVIARTWSFTDSCGNSSTFDQTIIIEDNEAPIFEGELPGDETAECDAVPDAPTLTAIDNCGEATVEFEETTEAGACDGEEVITRTWIASDDCGNTTTHTQTITVIDTTPPVFEGIEDATCTNLVINGEFESNPFSQGFQQLPQDQVEGWSTTKNHGTIEIQRSGQINGVESHSGNYHFELNGKNLDDLYQSFATEPGSNLTITFYHKKRPGSSVTDDMRLMMGASLSELVMISDYSVSTEDGWKQNVVNYSVPEGQTNTVILFQALSGSSNSVGNLMDTISIVSDTDDGVVCLPNDITVECDMVPEPIELTATDDCSEATVSFSEERIDGDCDNNYTLIRTWTATDACGNTTSISQNVEVRDTTSPEFVEALPQDIEVECEMIPEPEVLTATDNCGDAQVTFEEEIVYEDEDSESSDECTYRSYYVKSGSTSQFYKFVVENGVANLELVTSRNYNAHLAYDGENNILYGLVSNGQSIERIDPSTGNSLGFIQLNDGLSNIASGTYYNGKVYLGSSNQNRIVEVDPNNGSYVDYATDVPVNGADMEFKDGKLYLTTRSGNDLYLIENGTASLIGSIPNSVSGMSLTEDGNFYLSYNGSNSFEIIDENAQSLGSLPVFLDGQPFNLDNGDMASGCGTDGPPNIGDCNDYTLVRTWTATDACNNVTIHTQSIRVTDTTPPVFDGDLPTDTTVECTDVPNPEDLTATDNCGEAIVSFVEFSTPGSCEGEYLLERTWTAFDTCGNSTSHTQILTVIDTTAPEIIGDFEPEIEASCDAIPETPDLEFADACSEVMDVTFTEENTQQPDFEDYQIIRTWTVTDTCGNEAVYTQTVNVTNESPVGGLDSRICNTEGPYDLFSFLTGDYEGTGEWTVVQGDPSLLVGSTFTTESIEQDTQFIFNYTELGGSCAINTNLAIFVEDCRVLSCGAEDVIISKTVTANGDGLNDVFRVSGIEDCGFVIEVQL
ncbi:HYR-like domain-containing protein, partial [Winogradskyella aurantiaca]|uniref:HYR-like domain-containing protein n=1 Tax=Winogradskyella aurantiaca TaxID=2219558 RepID=UPI0013002051